MSGFVVEPEQTATIEPPLSDLAADPVRPRTRRSRATTQIQVPAEPSAEERAEQRRAARRVFRLYCFACGRASEAKTAPLRPGRCPACGGSMMTRVG